jgi:DNA-binding NarL/FixJ family response regulator
LRTLEGALQATAAGHGGLVLISGEAGIGKSALVRHVLACAGRLRAAVVVANCYDLEVTPPFGPWIELFRSNPVLDAERSPFDPSSANGSGQSGTRAALYEAVWERFVGLAERAPVVLVLEDIHWADQASLDLLRAISRRFQEIPMLCIATFRDAELTSRQPLFRMLPPLIRESKADRLALRQLEAAAVGMLVATRYSLPARDQRRLVSYLMRYAEGNAFFTEELLNTLEDNGVLELGSDGWSLGELAAFRVPPLLRQVLESRLERLESRAHVLLQVAAVVGGEVPLDVWQAVSEASDQEIAGAIEQALEARVMVESPGRAVLQFRHALIREALYDQLLLPRRRDWHRTIADYLVVQASPDPDSVAYHYQQANENALAAEWLVRAGRRASRAFAYQITLDRFEQALTILERTDRDADRAWLLIELAEAYRYSDARRALRYANEALAYAAEAEDRALEAIVLRSHAHVRGFLGEDALAEVERSESLFQALSPGDRERVLASPLGYAFAEGTYAQRIAYYGQYGRALETARAYLDRSPAPTTVDEHQRHAIAYMGVALGAAGLGDVEMAREAFTACRMHFEHTGNTFGPAYNYAFEYSMILHIYLPHLVDERRRYIEEVDRLFAQSVFADVTADPHAVRLLWALMLEGRWQEAGDAALAMSAIDGVRVDSLVALAELDRLRGHPERALAHIAQVLPAGAAAEPGSVFYERLLTLPRVAAEIEIERGHLDAARAWIESLERRLLASEIAYGRAEPHILRARYLQALGELEQAQHQAQEAVERASSPIQPLALIEAYRTLATIATAAGHAEESRRHANKALRLALSCEAPYEIASARLALAEQALTSGSSSEALTLAEQVRKTAEQLGAQPLMQRAEDVHTRAADYSPEQADASQGLSSREIEVLRLVARGMTDAEVANQLFISPRTVSGHLQSIYNKLGVSSRVAATAFAFQHDLV